MSSFKQRSNRLKLVSNIQTIDNEYKHYIAKINDEKCSLPQKKMIIKNLQNELNSIEGKNAASSQDIKKKSQLKTKIAQLSSEINKIENNFDILYHMSKTGNILVDYYSDSVHTSEDENTKPIVDLSEITKSNNEIFKNSQKKVPDKLDELNKLNQQNYKNKRPVKKRKIIRNNTETKPILQYFMTQPETLQTDSSQESKPRKKSINRAQLQEKYLTLTDPTYCIPKSKSEKMAVCDKCNVKKSFCYTEGYYICNLCQEIEYIIIENEGTYHKDSNEKQQKYPYKKVNHFKEKLNQFQSKESTDIPDNICNIVINDLRKKRIDRKLCTPPDVYSILRKHRLTGYYEHLQQIYCKISGASPIILSRDIEEKMISMFLEMQDTFHAHCPKTRSNFLNYAYVINKLFRILHMPEHAKYFSLLKSKEKLREQDIIWNKICKDMNWDFYSSA